jgi:pimeloyl-ACP methyl ester carboxylesterase
MTAMQLSRRHALIAGATLAAAPALPLAAETRAIVADEFWTDKSGVRLWVYRKRLEGAAPQGRLFCVHGSSYSGKTMFDLQVPDRDYSMMDWFARRGYEVWTMDHEGYGHSQRTKATPTSRAAWTTSRPRWRSSRRRRVWGSSRFFGQSSGALRAARFAEQHPAHVEKLALDAFVWTGKDSPTLKERAKRVDEWRASNMRKVSAEFYRSVFTRDHSGAAEPMLGDIIAREELRYGDSVPTGTYLDMVTKLPLVDPAKVQCPVLIVRAEHDGIATDEDILGFYARLPNPDKQLVKIAGLAHTAILGVNRGRFLHALHAFLTMPPRTDLAGAAAHG